MSSYTTQYYPSAPGALPIPSAKGTQYQYDYQYPSYYTSGGDSTYSVSPPEGPDAVSVSSGSAGLASYGTSSCYTATSTSGGSAYDSTAASAAGIDLHDYMQDRFAETFDPLPLDSCTVKQAQTSGHLNAKHRELLELQAKAQARLAKSRARFAQGLEDAREVRGDLEWTQKKVSALKQKAAKKHSKEYQKARARYPSPDDSY
ncbi:hypothetical protein B0T18DRAFT_216342 [Schizothecium vesticola]|uniref:Biogenesis of lysosome-related organelles complex 1 subunit KXD1 n=1 Tax=Schizothecium vesticola TaxID=314040 RepID=A0AA40EK54_9PEZI|nr:hypothetical protein B0T18DRAFT_216342 [Schizothecium vesticola]